jgi:transcriptional regulator
MYIPEINRVTDQAVIDDFVRTHDFATLITSSAEGIPVVSHIPLVLEVKNDGERLLHGHLARGNTHWKLLEEGRTTLAIFHGPHSYVSARWYNHENVPTWNYQVVHASCKPRIFTDRAALHETVDTLTKVYEHGTGYSVEGLSPKFLATELRGIVGFTLHVERFEAKFKLSQNRDAENYANVVEQLSQNTNPESKAVAESMKLHNPHQHK